MPYIITDDCNQCSACETGCDNRAIKEGPKRYVIDIMLCGECGVCAENCPFQAIAFEKESIN